MTVTLSFTREKETKLRRQADRAGLSLDEYVQRMIDQTADESQESAPVRSLAELLEGRIGTVEGPADLSESTGRKFAALMQVKRKAGRL